MILNVDDHEPGRYARTRLVRQAGYEVTEAGTGLLALELAESLRPWLVMLDVNLPDLSGLEVCRRIKADPQLSATPVLQISASAITPSDRARGLENGADAYLIEPVDPDVLIATIRALLRMSKAEAELSEANHALQIVNERLTKTNEDLQSFAHAASHDLKEPLRTISCFAGLLENQYAGRFDAEAEEMLTNIQKGASRMTALIDGLLAYAQAGPANQDDWADVDLDEVVAGAVRNLERSIQEGEASVTFGRLPTVRGNETSLSQLFQNLLQNGLKYHRPGEPARLEITAPAQARGMVEIAIADNGLGIPLEYQRRIFAPFQRLHGSDVSGFGIGLATCQRIVEKHGGKIWVVSGGLGEGSTFHFSLPSAEQSQR